MKKIWLMLLMICSVCAFSACSDDDDDKKGDEEKVCPVTEIVVPETAEAEGTVTITGKGFATTAKIALQKEEEQPMEVEARITSTEVTFKVPAKFMGDYNVILTQDGVWKIGTINITAAARGLRVKKIIANNQDEHVFQFTYDDQNRISNITRIPNQIENYAWSFDFTYEENRINVSATYNDPDGAEKGNFSFNLSDGKIISTLDEEGTESPWEYNENNYLTCGGYEECDFTWENNNLTELYSNYAYTRGKAIFDNSELKNNSSIDIVPIMYNYFAYVLDNDEHDILAYMLGICGNRSINLPTEMTDNSGDMQTINYTMNSEHSEYISEASINTTEEGTYSIKFIYE